MVFKEQEHGETIFPDTREKDCSGPESSLKRQTSTDEKKYAALQEELEALRWQVDYDKKLLYEIKSSRSWRLARMYHYLFGFLTADRKILKEAKNDLDDLLVRESCSGRNSRVKMASFFRCLLNGTTKIFKRISPPVQTAWPPENAEAVYQSCYQENESFGCFPRDLKTVVFYLPQYHTFPENDKYWGKGFTEWVNIRKAKPRFPGHYQPRIPHRDIGYYDLSDLETMKKQAALARQHGIDYFCFYYYWFDGKKLMEKPLDQLIANPEIDMKFCLCWANENWTRTWDGQQEAVLIRQNYSEENDIKFIHDLKKYIMDPRYMRCCGKPVILVYHAKIMPEPDRTFAAWRKWCRQNGVGEIQIWSCRIFIKSNEFRKPVELDREVEFPPHMVSELELFPPALFHAYKDDGSYCNYRKILQALHDGKTMADQSPHPFYRCAMLGWDNSCRRKSGYSVWQYFSLSGYHYWLRKNIEYTRKHFLEKERFLFINAWNEWAEGTYLEPDARYGYASINTTSRALCDLPFEAEYNSLMPFADAMPQPGKILIHLHGSYPELMQEFTNYLNQMPFEYDCMITTGNQEKAAAVKKSLEDAPLLKCRKCSVRVMPNQGGDAEPFFAVCRDRLEQYDYIGHFHAEKSPSVPWDDERRHYLLDQLLGRPEYIKAVFLRFERDAALGLFCPPPHPCMRTCRNWKESRGRCEELLQTKMYAELPEHPFFPGGQMFWARSKALAPLFAPGIVEPAAFEKYVAEGSGYTTLAGVFPPIHPDTGEMEKVRRLALYIHDSADQELSPVDLYLLRELKKSADVVCISSPLSGKAEKELSCIVKKVILHDNTGYGFGAWRDALKQCSLVGYDELILLNNSVFGPFCSFEEIFSRMSEKKADFWGMTGYPETGDSRREEEKYLSGGVIHRHIQSYFLVFKRCVFESAAFKDFWDSVKDETSLPHETDRYEAQLSSLLEKSGFRSDVYLRAAERLQELDTTAMSCRPQDFLILGFPFLKKNICYSMDQTEINETIHLISRLTPYPVENINSQFL